MLLSIIILISILILILVFLAGYIITLRKELSKIKFYLLLAGCVVCISFFVYVIITLSLTV